MLTELRACPGFVQQLGSVWPIWLQAVGSIWQYQLVSVHFQVPTLRESASV
jgi:hypothetical protein